MYKAKEEKMLKKSNKEIKKKKLQEQGITLIALVITIVILLILAGVTLNAAIGDNGLFQRAKLATEKYEEAEANETASLAQFEKEIKNAYIDYNDYVGTVVEGYTPVTKSDGYTIGATVSGAAQTIEQEDMQWQIWDYDNAKGIVRLISSKPTEATLTLSNVNGYNNGVWAVNEVCRELYSNGQTGVSVANLKRSDIQKVMTYDYTDYSHDNADSTDKNGKGAYHYGNAKTYDQNNKYPIMWQKYDQNWAYFKNGKDQSESTETSNVIKDGEDVTEGKEGLIWEQENGSEGSMEGGSQGDKDTQFKQSYWRHDWNKNTVTASDWVNPKYYDLLFGPTSGHFGKTYWLACRYVYLNDSYCNFGLQNVYANSSNCSVTGGDVYYSRRHDECT